MGLNSGVSGSEFFRIFIWLFGAASLPSLLIGGLAGLAVALVLSLVMTPLVMLLTSKLAHFAGRLYSGKDANWSEQELLKAELVQARFFMDHKRYQEALVKLDATLAKDGDFSEALYLKAQVLWHGFEDRSSAIQVLRHLLASGAPTDQYYRWALVLLDELTLVTESDE